MSNNSNNLNIPQARQGMEQFRMRSRQEVGINLQPGYNGHLTSREASSVSRQMVVPYELRGTRERTEPRWGMC